MRAGELCCIVIDEVHMISDPQRGPALELAITKILHSEHAAAIQIVGMSATMGGANCPRWIAQSVQDTILVRACCMFRSKMRSYVWLSRP